ncbi:MAG: hypothetical protein A2V60_00805 [Candidatus Portnoybacteria bacterium RIFCSPHIGHO2_01_FULL_39_19]|nr:MAG: hypothetical protein A2V60_00805 [Candidatus Portnoybacteria bacterium RIFCSPHIGHO2_01_FULL_39_19]
MPATNQERENLSELNQERGPEQTGDKKSATHSDSKPNIVVYAIMATIGGIGDLLALIIPLPVIASILRFPFSLTIWFWKLCSGKLKESPGQKILKNAIWGATPVPSNTMFIVTSYLEETKLGQKTIGAAKKTSVKT